ncbi:MAG: Acetyl-coenzyme A carboxylase carboxyl transferase subunit alpha [Elusimicrobia bacterium ADurb.Bin231]|nr:MAG: Acetyl-coenzyme A carboxylase carboxyl transferase subunit alpha [Elusimicrobia bacterium ADurb.Bin231]
MNTLDFEKPILELERKIEELKKASPQYKGGFFTDIKKLENKCESLKREIFANLNPWQKVTLARHPRRPNTLDFIRLTMTDFVELHGDRYFSDDKAIIAGFARFNGSAVAVVGHQKGSDTEENVSRNFGMPNPEGYRKALRVFKLAEKFGRPVITFVNTPGAYPGIGAEERGQAEAIAKNLMEMSSLRVPIITCVIGEGGSGGALAISVGDKLLMLENAVYSVISPEGCLAILFKDANTSIPEIAASLKLTAQDLKKFGICDEIIKEPLGGAHRNIEVTAQLVAAALKRHIDKIKKIPIKKLLALRYKKYRQMGAFSSAKNKI